MSCTLQDAGEFVQVLVGEAPEHTVLDCYRELLSLCARHRIDKALLVSADGDETTQAALSRAIDEMSHDERAEHLRLAMVARAPEKFHLYRAAEKAAAERGITARAFQERREAVEWLIGQRADRR